VEEIDKFLNFEERHTVLIKKFGRYPHRNEHLGREYTAAEKRYMYRGGELFRTRSIA
jgi:uncharacterized protein (DUF924 family)